MRRAALLFLLVLPLSACWEDMSSQPKYTFYEPSSLWQDNASARPLPGGTVALDAPPEGRPEVDRALLERGRVRYDVFCSPCHGPTGAGDGRVVQRGFPTPPSYFSARLRAAPARHFYDVITDGYGVMYSYADRVPRRDRWAITAYIRALQLAEPETVAGWPTRDAVPLEKPR
jgi:mono/diheme cytochrome c family protein